MMEILPEGLPFELANTELNKKAISRLINASYRLLGLKDTVVFADQLMYTGYRYATRSGISIGVDDMLIPAEKKPIIEPPRRKWSRSSSSTNRVWSPPASATTRWSTSGRVPASWSPRR